MSLWQYERVKSVLKNETMPCMVVDIPTLHANIDRLVQIAKAHGKSLRMATKSVRVTALIQTILERGGDTCKGLMCFSAAEAAFLAAKGFDDFLVAYPGIQVADLQAVRAVQAGGGTIAMMVDHPDQLEAMALALQSCDKGPPIDLCIDVDISYRPTGHIHLGVRRSSILSVHQFQQLADKINAHPDFRLAGIMGYEAQVAGLPDRNPFNAWQNGIKSMIKKRSIKDVAAKREAIAKLGYEIRFFNGGGTGSLQSASEEPWLTEVTAGSGFLQSQLFDYYDSNRNEAAFAFALPVTRKPAPGIVTCHSGGFIASGEVSPDKQPRPFLPAGLNTISSEGCGEVQTPVTGDATEQLKIGDPVLFRPAKAGEIAERFAEYLLVDGDKIVDHVPTYRGEGVTFY